MQEAGKTLHILLGANGDICAMLPFLQLEADRTGQKALCMVATKFIPILEGVSYVKPVEWQGDFHQLPQALEFIRSEVPEVRAKPLQIYANVGAGIKCSSFVPDMWRIAGCADEWDSFPLVFDQRSKNREAELIASIDDGRPMILVAGEGKSSPFMFHAELFASIRAEFCRTHNIVNLASVRAHRAYDLLALYDRADALVSIDTMHLHLSRASKVPVFALTASDPAGWKGLKGWHASPPYKNQVFRQSYEFYAKQPMEVVAALREHIRKEVKPLPTITHVYSNYARKDDAARRHALALRTWEIERRFATMGRMGIFDETLHRSKFGLPYVKDLIERAETDDDSDIILITNDDTCFASGISQQIIHACETAGSGFAHRWDSLVPLVCPVQQQDIRKLKWYAGSDMFCFTMAWWKQFKNDFPDMLIGCEAWDRIMRELIRFTGGSELIEAIYHERHESKWEEERLTHPGNIHNRTLARKWLKERNIPLAELDFTETP